MGHGGTAIDELSSDHREVEDPFGQIKAAVHPGDQAWRARRMPSTRPHPTALTGRGKP